MIIYISCTSINIFNRLDGCSVFVKPFKSQPCEVLAGEQVPQYHAFPNLPSPLSYSESVPFLEGFKCSLGGYSDLIPRLVATLLFFLGLTRCFRMVGCRNRSHGPMALSLCSFLMIVMLPLGFVVLVVMGMIPVSYIFKYHASLRALHTATVE